MQINIVNAIQTAKSKAASKTSKSDGFGDCLKNAQKADKKDNSELAQAMGAYGYAVSQQQQQRPEDAQNGTARGNADNGSVNGVQLLNSDGSGNAEPNVADMVGILASKIHNYVVTKQETAEHDAKVDALLAATAPQPKQQATKTAETVLANTSVLPELNFGDPSKQIGNVLNAPSALAAPDENAGKTDRQLLQNAADTANLKVTSTAQAVSKQQANSAAVVQALQKDTGVQAAQAQPAAAGSFAAQLDAAANAPAQTTQPQTAQVLSAQPAAVSTAQVGEKPVKAAEPLDTPAKAVQAQPQSAAVNESAKFARTGSDDGKGKNSETKNQDDNGTAQSIFASQMNRIDTKSIDVTPKAKTELTNQVADAVKQAVDTGRTEVRFHLSPEDLGGISIRVISQNGMLSVHIAADNQHTGQLLAQSMHELSQSMQDQGINMNKAEVTYAGAGGFDAATSQQQQQNQQSASQLPKWVPAMESQKTAVSGLAGVSAGTGVYTKNTGMSILA